MPLLASAKFKKGKKKKGISRTSSDGTFKNLGHPNHSSKSPSELQEGIVNCCYLNISCELKLAY